MAEKTSRATYSLRQRMNSSLLHHLSFHLCPMSSQFAHEAYLRRIGAVPNRATRFPHYLAKCVGI